MSAVETLELVDKRIASMADVFGRKGLADDVAQEARLAVWRTLEKLPADDDRDPVGLALWTAKRAIGRASGRQLWTSSEKRLKGPQPSATGELEDSLDELLTAHPEEERSALDPELDAVVIREGMRDALSSALAQLDPEDALFVWLRFWRDRSTRDIARQLDVPEGTLSRRWSQRIRPRLAELLGDWR